MYGSLYIYTVYVQDIVLEILVLSPTTGGGHFVGNDWPISLLETSDITQALNRQPSLTGQGGCPFLGLHDAR